MDKNRKKSEKPFINKTSEKQRENNSEEKSSTKKRIIKIRRNSSSAKKMDQTSENLDDSLCCEKIPEINSSSLMKSHLIGKQLNFSPENRKGSEAQKSKKSHEKPPIKSAARSKSKGKMN